MMAPNPRVILLPIPLHPLIPRRRQTLFRAFSQKVDLPGTLINTKIPTVLTWTTTLRRLGPSGRRPD